MHLKKHTLQYTATLENKKKNAQRNSSTSMQSKMPVLSTSCMCTLPICHHSVSAWEYLVELCSFFSAMWTVKQQRGTQKMNRKMPVQAQVKQLRYSRQNLGFRES